MSNFDFESLYLRALKNTYKPKRRSNWAHVSCLGVGSTKAREICRHFGIDPEGTEFKREPKADTEG